MRAPNTRVHYMYRDASNYKFYGEFTVAGDFDLASITETLVDGEFFIPERVGLPSLFPTPQNEDDHWLHAFLEVEPSMEPKAFCAVGEFVRRMKSASDEGWFALENDWVPRPKIFKPVIDPGFG